MVLCHDLLRGDNKPMHQGNETHSPEMSRIPVPPKKTKEVAPQPETMFGFSGKSKICEVLAGDSKFHFGDQTLPGFLELEVTS